MDTDGEIDVDNCDDRECKTWTDPGVTCRKTHSQSKNVVMEQTTVCLLGRRMLHNSAICCLEKEMG